jgi:hypothetical protein
MLKKIAMWTVFAGLSAVLIVGAVNRTSSKVTQAAEAQTPRNVRAAESQQLSVGNSDSMTQSGNGRIQGQGGNAKSDLDTASNAGAVNGDWISLTASVDEVTADALTLEREDGYLLIIEGRAWRYALESGFSTEPGVVVLATGFYENGEFKPVTLEDLTGVHSVVLRQESGQPMWAGSGRNRSNT